METRAFGRTELDASVIGLGTWQLGADWGNVEDSAAHDTLQAAVESGVTFFDTADVYGDGVSERRIAAFRRAHPEHDLVVVTKMGRRVEQRPENYTPEAFAAWNERSRENLGVDCIDLVQLHCPPTEVLANPTTWEELQRMVDLGHIRHFGASVETCEQAHIAMDRGARSVQIILNIFRRKPLDTVLAEAQERGVAVIARVPLASGLLSGKYTMDTVFPENDHRNYNRNGGSFDVGETFSGVPYSVGIDAAARFTELCTAYGPEGATPAQIALKWVTEQPGVTTVIPGARNVEQARANAQAALLPKLSADFTAAVENLYDEVLRQHIHDRW